MTKYAWWLVVGALAGLGVAALLTIGPLLLVVAGLLALAGARIPALRGGVAAIPAGVGLVALYLAWLNRSGPGDVCETTATEVHCSQQWSPWPFVAVAALLVAVSVFLARSR